MELINTPETQKARDATDSLAGYAYQIYLSLNEWLSLTGDEVLLLEAAEDYAVMANAALHLSQVKHERSGRRVTLRHPGVIKALSGLWDYQVANGDLVVRLTYVTTAAPGIEKASPIRVPGIQYWNDVRNGADLAPLRDLLLTLQLPDGFRAFLGLEDNVIRERLLERVTWAHSSDSLEEARKKIEDQLTLVASSRNLLASDGNDALPRLVEHLLRKIVSGDKRLTRVDFERAFDGAMMVPMGRGDVRRYIQIASDQEARAGQTFSTNGLVLEPRPETLPFGLRPRVQLLFRDKELEALRSHFSRRLQAGSVVAICGEPLSGKSELIRHFVAQVACSADSEPIACLHVDLRSAEWPLRALFLALRGATHGAIPSIGTDDADSWPDPISEFLTIQLPHAIGHRRLIAVFERLSSLADRADTMENLNLILESSAFEAALNIVECSNRLVVSPRLPPIELRVHALPILDAVAFLIKLGQSAPVAQETVAGLSGWAEESLMPGILAAAADAAAVAEVSDPEFLQDAILSAAAQIAYQTIAIICRRAGASVEETLLTLMILALIEDTRLAASSAGSARLADIPRSQLESAGWFDGTQCRPTGFAQDALRSAAGLVLAGKFLVSECFKDQLLNSIVQISLETFQGSGLPTADRLDSLVAWLRRYAPEDEDRWISLEILLQQVAAGDAIGPTMHPRTSPMSEAILRQAETGNVDAAITALILHARESQGEDLSHVRKEFMRAAERVASLVRSNGLESSRQLGAIEAALRIGGQRLGVLDRVAEVRATIAAGLRDLPADMLTGEDGNWLRPWLSLMTDQVETLAAINRRGEATNLIRSTDRICMMASAWADESMLLSTRARLALVRGRIATEQSEIEAALLTAEESAAGLVSHRPYDAGAIRFYLRVVRQRMRAAITDNARQDLVERSREHLSQCLGELGTWSVPARSMFAALMRDEARRAWSEHQREVRTHKALLLLHGERERDAEVLRDSLASLVEARLLALLGRQSDAIESCNRALSLKLSAAAWHLKLRLSDGWKGRLSFDDTESQRPISATLRRSIGEFRDWLKSQSSPTEDFGPVILWTHQREWQNEGSLERSLISQLERTGVDFRYLPQERRVKLLRDLFSRRYGKLVALEHRFGASIPLAVAKLQNRGQLVRSVAIALRTTDVADGDPRDDLASALEKFPNDHTLRFYEAEYSRYIWDFERAIAGFKYVEASAPDGELRRDASLALARTLLSFLAELEPEQIGESQAANIRETVRSLEDILNSSGHSDEAAILRDHLRLELGDYIEWSPLEKMYDKCVGRIDGFPTTLISTYTSNTSQEASMASSIAELLKADATSPRFLGAAGLMYLRIVHKGRADDPMTDLVRALAFFRAKALMERSWDLVEHSTTSFNIGWTILLAAELMNNLDPIEGLNVDGKRDQLAYAEAKFSAAESRSAGAFRDRARQYSARAARLRSSLRAQIAAP